jgi:cyanophycinase
MPAPKLLAIGGAEDRIGESRVLKEFVKGAGGETAEILIMPVATDNPPETVAEYRNTFRRFGVRHIKSFDVSLREDTTSKRGRNLIESATGIFFSGGDQLDIASLLGGTALLDSIRRRHKRGTIIGGTSAGAAMMSSSMLLSGEPEESPHFGGVEIGPGLNFINGTIIDTHFSQRGRCGRLMTAVAHYPQNIGLGIDEDTALLISNGKFRVIGSGSVVVVDGTSMTHTNLNELKHGERLELHDLTIHVLPADSQFDLKKHRPLFARRRRKKSR